MDISQSHLTISSTVILNMWGAGSGIKETPTSGVGLTGYKHTLIILSGFPFNSRASIILKELKKYIQWTD